MHNKCKTCGIPKMGHARKSPRCRSCANAKSAADRGQEPGRKRCPLCDQKKPSSHSLCLSCHRSNPRREPLTEEAKAKIKAKAFARWAKYRKNGFGLTEDGRRRIAEAQYRRWGKPGAKKSEELTLDDTNHNACKPDSKDDYARPKEDKK